MKLIRFSFLWYPMAAYGPKGDKRIMSCIIEDAKKHLTAKKLVNVTRAQVRGQPHWGGKDPAAPFHSTVRIWAGHKRLKTQHVEHESPWWFEKIMREMKKAKKKGEKTNKKERRGPEE